MWSDDVDSLEPPEERHDHQIPSGEDEYRQHERGQEERREYESNHAHDGTQPLRTIDCTHQERIPLSGLDVEDADDDEKEYRPDDTHSKPMVSSHDKIRSLDALQAGCSQVFTYYIK